MEGEPEESRSGIGKGRCWWKDREEGKARKEARGKKTGKGRHE